MEDSGELLPKENRKSHRYSSVGEHELPMGKALGSISSNIKKIHVKI